MDDTPATIWKQFGKYVRLKTHAFPARRTRFNPGHERGRFRCPIVYEPSNGCCACEENFR